VENKQYELNEQIDIQEVTQDAIGEMEDFIRLKNLTIDRELEQPIMVQGNRELIHSAIYNILQNAVKFSPENATIRIATLSQNGHKELQITDEGIRFLTDSKEEAAPQTSR
ncbi:MAG: hypothetical protein GVY02_02325, partial [Bacteroidetes bacterium]|jgi:signal transduction histidine kinase|nr:hypothetical protein [Bacteroidota bacterium]